MKKKKDRSAKKYVPRSRDTVLLKYEPWRLNLVFDPLTAILDQLEQEGTITTSGAGQPMFLDASDGRWYDTAAALRGFIEMYEMYEIRYATPLPLEPLRILLAKIEGDQLIDSFDTASVRAAASVMRLASMRMTVGEARELVDDYNLKEELENVV